VLSYPRSAGVGRLDQAADADGERLHRERAWSFTASPVEVAVADYGVLGIPRDEQHLEDTTRTRAPSASWRPFMPPGRPTSGTSRSTRTSDCSTSTRPRRPSPQWKCSRDPPVPLSPTCRRLVHRPPPGPSRRARRALRRQLDHRRESNLGRPLIYSVAPCCGGHRRSSIYSPVGNIGDTWHFED
jgi:hypothetical protein